MRIVFMGTPDFAIPSLKILLDNHYDIVSVVTVTDKPAGRGLQLSTSAVKQYAQNQGLRLLQPERMKDEYFIRQLIALKPDIFVVVAFRILPPEVFQIPKLGSFNLHASLLPKYRGAAPINWAIIRGEKETGVTSFFLQEKVDTGNIILQARVPIGPDENAGELHDKLSDIGAEIVLHTVRLIEAGKVSPKLQDDSLASTAPKIFKDHCRIDWNKPAAQIHDLIRGLSPRPGAFTMYDGRILKIYRSQIVDVDKKCTSGEVLQADNKLIMKTNDGAIELLDLQLEGKKRMSVEDFLRGYRLTIGDKFS